jgi:hypothetical protein
MADAIDRGRESFRRRAWGDAFAQLSVAEGDSHLELEDLERLAAAAYLVGRVDDSVDAWARAHHEYMQAGEVARAAHCAFWLAFVLLNKGELGGGGGWVHRAQRLLDDGHGIVSSRDMCAIAPPPLGVQRRRAGRPRGLCRGDRSAIGSATRS